MESLSTFVQSPLSFQFSLVACGLIVIIFFWWRAGSIHSVLDRLWLLVAGKSDVSDPVLKSLLQESRDIEKFVYTYRIKVETIAAIHKLDAWRKANEIGMAHIQKMRPWIDVTTAEVVRQPPKQYVLSRFTFACLAMLSVVGISQLVASRDAYLQMRASEVWFKTDGISIKAPREGWSFDEAMCASDRGALVHMTGFSSSETDVICDAMKDGGLKPLVKQTIQVQVLAGFSFALIAIVIAVINILAGAAAAEAQRLRKKLYPAPIEQSC